MGRGRRDSDVSDSGRSSSGGWYDDDDEVDLDNMSIRTETSTSSVEANENALLNSHRGYDTDDVSEDSYSSSSSSSSGGGRGTSPTESDLFSSSDSDHGSPMRAVPVGTGSLRNNQRRSPAAGKRQVSWTAPEAVPQLTKQGSWQSLAGSLSNVRIDLAKKGAANWPYYSKRLAIPLVPLLTVLLLILVQWSFGDTHPFVPTTASIFVWVFVNLGMIMTPLKYVYPDTARGTTLLVVLLCVSAFNSGIEAMVLSYFGKRNAWTWGVVLFQTEATVIVLIYWAKSCGSWGERLHRLRLLFTYAPRGMAQAEMREVSPGVAAHVNPPTLLPAVNFLLQAFGVLSVVLRYQHDLDMDVFVLAAAPVIVLISLIDRTKMYTYSFAYLTLYVLVLVPAFNFAATTMHGMFVAAQQSDGNAEALQVGVALAFIALMRLAMALLMFTVENMTTKSMFARFIFLAQFYDHFVFTAFFTNTSVASPIFWIMLVLKSIRTYLRNSGEFSWMVAKLKARMGMRFIAAIPALEVQFRVKLAQQYSMAETTSLFMVLMAQSAFQLSGYVPFSLRTELSVGEAWVRFPIMLFALMASQRFAKSRFKKLIEAMNALSNVNIHPDSHDSQATIEVEGEDDLENAGTKAKGKKDDNFVTILQATNDHDVPVGRWEAGRITVAESIPFKASPDGAAAAVRAMRNDIPHPQISPMPGRTQRRVSLKSVKSASFLGPELSAAISHQDNVSRMNDTSNSFSESGLDTDLSSSANSMLDLTDSYDSVDIHYRGDNRVAESAVDGNPVFSARGFIRTNRSRLSIMENAQTVGTRLTFQKFLQQHRLTSVGKSIRGDMVFTTSLGYRKLLIHNLKNWTFFVIVVIYAVYAAIAPPQMPVRYSFASLRHFVDVTMD
eukprot:GFYU01004278.1.p1 GENE.GFYU01004278.1~~GFYU01004278.1.p1  ORF type:complete len:891 (-),score=173.63 GFYU01004278.1:123-2795(-)